MSEIEHWNEIDFHLVITWIDDRDPQAPPNVPREYRELTINRITMEEMFGKARLKKIEQIILDKANDVSIRIKNNQRHT